MSTFGEILHQYRLIARLTQEELAERAQISVYSISNIERGIAHRPRIDTLRRLASALNLTTHDTELFFTATTTTKIQQESLPLFPSPLTPIIGREREIQALSEMLASQATKLVTLTGMGGVGKTRLALELLHRHDNLRGMFIDLSDLTQTELILPTLGKKLGIKEQTNHNLFKDIVHEIQMRIRLLVIDNFERLVGSALLITEILSFCPALQIIVTSRVPLHIQGEFRYVVNPLPVPASHAEQTKSLAEQVSSVQLFLARTRQIQNDFALTNENVGYICEICRKLEGIPLVIELVTTRLVLFSLPELQHQLDQRLDIPNLETHNLPARQQTLRATLNWSYSLLKPTEQKLLQLLSVFVKGCRVETACTMYNRTYPQNTLSPIALFDIMVGLVEHHFLQREESEPVRVQMRETIHEYAWEHLIAANELALVQNIHAAIYLEVAEKAWEERESQNQVVWFDRLEEEQMNIYAAIEWSIDYKEREKTLRLVAALCPFWYIRGHFVEGRSWIEQVIERDNNIELSANADVNVSLARISNGGGWLSLGQGDYTSAEQYFHQALVIYQNLQSQRGIANALNNLGGVARLQGNYEQALLFFEESLALYRDANDLLGIASILGNIAGIAWAQRDLKKAQTLSEESLEIEKRIGNAIGIIVSCEGLGTLALERGETQTAHDWFTEELRIAREIKNIRHIAGALHHLGEVSALLNEHTKAFEFYQESLDLFQKMEDTASIASVFKSQADLFNNRREWDEARKFYLNSLNLFAKIGAKREQLECIEKMALLFLTMNEKIEIIQDAVYLLAIAANERANLGSLRAEGEEEQIQLANKQGIKLLGENEVTTLWQQAHLVTFEDAVGSLLIRMQSLL